MKLRRFLADAREVAAAAEDEARAAGAETIGQEHLLLALAGRRGTVAGAALAAAGAEYDAAKAASDAQFADALLAVGISLHDVEQQAGGELGPLPCGARLEFSPAAKRVLEDAVLTSRERGDRHIGGEHVLLALLEDRRGPAVRLLDRLDVESDAVRSALPPAPRLAGRS